MKGSIVVFNAVEPNFFNSKAPQSKELIQEVVLAIFRMISEASQVILFY